MTLIVLLVCFVVIMLVWGLGLGGAIDLKANQGWLAFLAVLILGIVIFLLGTGVIVIEHTSTSTVR